MNHVDGVRLCDCCFLRCRKLKLLKETIKSVLPASLVQTVQAYRRKQEEDQIRAKCRRSIMSAARWQHLDILAAQLEQIVPDLSQQDTNSDFRDSYWHLKMRIQHAFQCEMMLNAIRYLNKDKITIVDIGDSAGTHMMYIRELARHFCEVKTISVNLDPVAVQKIKARGLNAIQCRAEEVEKFIHDPVDLFTSFQMVEHLHNPALFFHRLAKNVSCNFFLVSVPFLRQSRVGLHSIRNNFKTKIFAEMEHIFELSPEDWSLLFLHSGWRVHQQQTYFQYRPGLIGSQPMRKFWIKNDYEGFWGALLSRDTEIADRYQDWEN